MANVCALLQIVNSTMLSLSIGEQTSGKKAMTVLATIAPGEAYSMPVLRKEPGLISVRPAGTFPLAHALCVAPGFKSWSHTSLMQDSTLQA